MDSYISNWENDKIFFSIYEEFNKLTEMTSSIDTALYARLYILRQLASQQSNRGNFAECGVYAGMSMFFVADLCKNNFIGIDSFQGVSKPSRHDTEYFKHHDLSIDIKYTSSFLKNFKNIILYRGWIPEVFNDIKENSYSYVNIDVDLYEPTKNSIEYFWPKIISGGVLICDDYGSEKTIGARKAMNDYFGQNNILELPTGQGIIFKNESI